MPNVYLSYDRQRRWQSSSNASTAAGANDTHLGGAGTASSRKLHQQQRRSSAACPMYISVTINSAGGKQAVMPAVLLERMTPILEVQAQQAAGTSTSNSSNMHTPHPLTRSCLALGSGVVAGCCQSPVESQTF